MLNDCVPQVLVRLDAALRPEVWHQTGARDAQSVAAAYQAHGISARVVPFIEDMAQAYAWADLALCRSGALTVAELATVGLASVLVPFAAAVDDHQTRNAEFLVQAAAAELLPQTQLSAQTLIPVLGGILGDRQRLMQMARRARALAKPDAAVKVAEACVQAGGAA